MDEHHHLCQADGWMEAVGGEWQEPGLQVTFRSASHHSAQWNDPQVQRCITTVDFSGFSMEGLNTRYVLRASEVIQGRPSYWDASGIYFIYWQRQMNRWAICDLKCLDAVRDGQSPGWAYRSDQGHFANACGWTETRDSGWESANVETAVVGACNKGLKVEFSGFGYKTELNTQYTERSDPDEEIQGKATFWDASGTYFIYWQSSTNRWAICDKASLKLAKDGMTPGWAYRTDPLHFAKANKWMEAVGGTGWQMATVMCTILEGNVRDDSSAPSVVKAEPTEDTGGTLLSTEQYKTLVRKVYEEKQPEKLEKLEKIFESYKGSEQKLFLQVCEKYKADAEALAAALPLPSEEAAEEAAEEEQPAGEDLENAEVPELSVMGYAVLIQNVYEKYNAAKLADFPLLLQKYRSRERELYHEVCKKYGVHPAKFHAQQQQAKAVGVS